MQLGFLEFEVPDVERWARFLREVVGLAEVGGGRLRMDGHAWRFQLVEGPLDDLSAVGWELSPEELERSLGRLKAAGHEIEARDPKERGAERRYRLRDPAGIPIELVTGLERAEEPFLSPVVEGGFVADELGLGHIVLSSPDKEASRRFYTELLGFRLSDHIVCEFYGFPVDLSFFHANPRHHSLALGGPQPKRLDHFMVEARELDQVGLAYDRTIRSGAEIRLTLGRHPNDRMLSFYAATPSGFQFELGWGGREVEEASWEPTTYDRISDWGHHPPLAVFRKRSHK